MRSIVIVPTYNERENLQRLVEQVLSSGDFDILVVDDNSPDGTGILADTLKRTHAGRVDVLHRPAKQGLGTAYKEGFTYALFRPHPFIFHMDADFSHRPADLPKLLMALREGADVALGSRYVEGGKTIGRSSVREMISLGGSRFAGLMLDLPFRDLTGGFKGFRKEALRQLDLASLRAKGFGFQIETTNQLYQKGLRIVEVPIEFADRAAGRSKMSLSIFWEAFWSVWRMRLDRLLETTRGPAENPSEDEDRTNKRAAA